MSPAIENEVSLDYKKHFATKLRMRFLNSKLIGVCLLLISCLIAGPTKGDEDPLVVRAGLYLNEIHDIDLKNNSFTADIWVWFVWKEEAVEAALGKAQYEPLESIEIPSAVVEKKVHGFIENRGPEIYASARWIVKVKKTFNIHKYPLDTHVLSISLEEAFWNRSEVRLVADKINSGIYDQIDTPVWSFNNIWAENAQSIYRTNFGDPDLPKSSRDTYSKAVFFWEIQKDKFKAFLKTFWVTFLAVVIGLLSLLVRPDDLDARFGLTVAAVFAISANSINISSRIANAHQFVLADLVQIISVLLLLACIIRSVVALKLMRRGAVYLGSVNRGDRWTLGALLFAYLLLICFVYLHNS